jgi:CheY-like chemotaxis protein
MIITDPHSILTVCVPDTQAADASATPVWRAHSAREALAMLRMARVDLLLTGLRLPDMSPWQLIRRMRGLSCPPRWALVATADLTAAEEIEARSLGAIAVIERMPSGGALDELLARARRAPATAAFATATSTTTSTTSTTATAAAATAAARLATSAGVFTQTRPRVVSERIEPLSTESQPCGSNS